MQTISAPLLYLGMDLYYLRFVHILNIFLWYDKRICLIGRYIDG